MVSHTPDSVPSGRIRLTYEDYLVLPENGMRHQILDGELHVTPAPSTQHQLVSKRLQRILESHAEDPGLGIVFNAPFDVVLNEHTIVQPDLVYISRTQDEILTDKNAQGSPDLLVEILSESSARQDRVVKAELYARFGVANYWIIDLDAQVIDEYVLKGDAYQEVGRASDVFTPALFPGLEIPLAPLFRPAFP